VTAHQHNQRAWDRLAARGDRFARPAVDEDFRRGLAGLDADGWLGASVRGVRLLCLAAGGGRHGPLYAAAGAVVTVVDISPAQLALDRQVAAQRGLQLQTMVSSMDDLQGLATEAFDVVIHPVSTCYVPQVRPVFQAVARVLRQGGLYISQHKQPTSLQTAAVPRPVLYSLETPYYQTEPLPAVLGSLHREGGTLEYLHRWEELLGGMCQAGLVIEDVREPFHGDPTAPLGSFAHRSHYVPPYVRVKARRREASAGGPTHAGLLVP
jgi:SAM-dependent methyltransferase